MYLFESFDSYISETSLYASHNAKQSKPRTIVCAGAHLKTGETVNMKNLWFLTILYNQNDNTYKKMDAEIWKFRSYLPGNMNTWTHLCI